MRAFAQKSTRGFLHLLLWKCGRGEISRESSVRHRVFALRAGKTVVAAVSSGNSGDSASNDTPTLTDCSM